MNPRKHIRHFSESSRNADLKNSGCVSLTLTRDFKPRYATPCWGLPGRDARFISCGIYVTVKPTKQFPQAKYDQAYETLISGNFTQAAKQFARLSSHNSVYPEIWYQYGSCCMETGDYDTATNAFNKVAELYENSASGLPPPFLVGSIAARNAR